MRLKSLVVAAATLVISVGSPMAQNRGGEQQMSCEQMTKRRVETLKKEVKISAEQEKKAQEIYAKSCKDSQQAMQSQDREKIRTIREEARRAIEEILTPEQAKLWKEYQAKQPRRGEGRGGQRGGGGGGRGGANK